MRMVCDSVQDMTKVAAIPKRTRPVIVKAATRVSYSEATEPPTKMVAMAIRVGKRPLQGTKLLVRIAMSRSRGESIIRQETIPAALQPNPMHVESVVLLQRKHML